MRRVRLLLFVAMLCCAVPAHPAFADHPAGDGALLPDLRTKEPERLSIVTSNGQRRLRFDNEVGNAHTGPLELVGSGASDCDGDGVVQPAEKPAFQRVYTDSDADGVFRRGVDTAYSEFQTGCIAYHPAHDHLHFQDFANYALARLSDGAVVASSYKVTFCIMDSKRFFSALPSSPGSAFFTDCNGPMQGISVGWSDEYPYTLADQYLVLNPGGQYIGDGEYCLFSVADPGSRLREGVNAGNAAAESNNWASVRVKLSSAGASVTRYSGTSCSGIGAEPWNTSSASGDTQAPTAPSGLSATAASSTRVDLAWTAATDDVGVTGYRIYRDGAMVGSVGHCHGVPGHHGTRGHHLRLPRARRGRRRQRVRPERDAQREDAGHRALRRRGRRAGRAGQPGKQPRHVHDAAHRRRQRSGRGDVPAVQRNRGDRTDRKRQAAPAHGQRHGRRAGGVRHRLDRARDRHQLEQPARAHERRDRRQGADRHASTWVEYDVTSLVAGDGAHSFVLATGSSDGIDFRSREYSDATRRPELVLTF